MPHMPFSLAVLALQIATCTPALIYDADTLTCTDRARLRIAGVNAQGLKGLPCPRELFVPDDAARAGSARTGALAWGNNCRTTVHRTSDRTGSRVSVPRGGSQPQQARSDRNAPERPRSALFTPGERRCSKMAKVRTPLSAQGLSAPPDSSSRLAGRLQIALDHPSQAQPGGLRHFRCRAMQLSPHAFPVRHTLQHPD